MRWGQVLRFAPWPQMPPRAAIWLIAPVYSMRERGCVFRTGDGADPHDKSNIRP